MKCFIDWLTEISAKEEDLPFEFTKEDIITWVKRIHENILSEGENLWNGRHYGDCTKLVVSCELCMYQSWLEKYKKYCVTLKKK